MSNNDHEIGDKILKFCESFFGEYENLNLLEAELLKKNILPEWQYINYLSRLAFCTEVGMKTILNIESSIGNKHNLIEIFKKMPDVFRESVEKKSGISIEKIEAFLESIKNIFVDFRYMEKKSLECFIEGVTFDNGNIVFSTAINNQNYLFIRQLLEETMEYNKYLNKNINRKLFLSKNWETDIDEIKALFYQELKRIQSLSCVAEK